MYRVDGEMLGPMDAPPMIIGGRTFLVIRYITEAIGAKIGWDGTQRKVTITTKVGDIIDLWIGKPTAQINGKDIEIDPGNPDVVPEIVNNRTLLPLRFVGEQLGAKGENGIIWHAAEKKIEMNIFDETCIPPFEWWLAVVSVDRVMGTIICRDSFGIEFDLIMDVSFPSDIKEGSRVIVNGPVNQTGLGERLIITCKGITLIETPENTEKIIGKIISIDCDGTETTIVILKSNGEEQEATIKGSALCGLSEDTWITVDIDEDGVVSDWNFVIDQIIEESSEEFGPILMKVLTVDLKEKIIRCNKPDDFHKDWRRAEEHAYRFINLELVTDIEDHRCYNIWYSRNHMNKEFLTKIERVPCPALFDVVFTKVPEVVLCGVGDKIKMKVTNNNEFPRVYTPIFRSETFDGYFKPDRDSIEIYPGESDLFSMNFVSGHEFEGIIEFEVGAVCDDVEVVESFEILFKKPQIELEKIETELKVVIGKTSRYELTVYNRGLNKARVEPILFAPEFPGEIHIAETYIYLKPGGSGKITLIITPNSDLLAGAESAIEYGVKLGDFEKRERVKIVFISDSFPEIIIDGQSVTNKLFTIKGHVEWKGLEPGSIKVIWDDNDKWIEVEDFPLTHQYEYAGDFVVSISAEAKTGEYIEITSLIDIPGKKPKIHVTDIVFSRTALRGITVEGFVDWNGLRKNSTTFYWNDGSEPTISDFPVYHSFTDNYWIQTIIIKSTTLEGPKAYDGWILFWFRTMQQVVPIRIKHLELNEDTPDWIIENMIRGRLDKHEKINYINCSVMYPGNVDFTRDDISRRPGGRHTN